jgi:hypothetical protein
MILLLINIKLITLKLVVYARHFDIRFKTLIGYKLFWDIIKK